MRRSSVHVEHHAFEVQDAVAQSPEPSAAYRKRYNQMMPGGGGLSDDTSSSTKGPPSVEDLSSTTPRRRPQRSRVGLVALMCTGATGDVVAFSKVFRSSAVAECLLTAL